MKDRRRTNRHQQSAGTQTFLSLSLCLSLPLAALSINTRVESRESEPLVHYLLIQLPSRASPPSCTSGPIPPTVKLESRHGAINGFPSRSTRPLCLVLVVIICTAVLNWFQYVSLFFFNGHFPSVYGSCGSSAVTCMTTAPSGFIPGVFKQQADSISKCGNDSVKIK